MAPNGWHVSDWRRVRLQPHIVLFQDVFVYRGDGARIGSDLKLGHLRDTYYAAQYGTLAPEASTIVSSGHAPAPSSTTEPPRRHSSGSRASTHRSR
jgi:hypothetical protein